MGLNVVLPYLILLAFRNPSSNFRHCPLFAVGFSRKYPVTVLSPGVKARPGRDADHSPPSSAEVVNE
jgi:hypothetical protein